MIQEKSVERQECDDYLARSADEANLQLALRKQHASTALIVTQGFEERSVGVLEMFAKAGVKLRAVVINRYADDTVPNTRYEERFERAADTVAAKRWSIVNNDYNGGWLTRAIKATDAERVIIDITGVSNRGLFGALDAAASSLRRISLAYSEAAEYWPKEKEWRKLNEDLSGHHTLAEIVDERPWLFGYDHRVEFIPGHEGYDSAGSGRALIGFLPFKCARLAAVLGKDDYTEFLFIAGRPRLPKNRWRLHALKKINEGIVKDWPVVTIPTFGYRKALAELSHLLFSERSLLERYNIHMAILGSKLQVTACWVFSTIVPSITIVTSVPFRYFPEAFSDGIGSKWIFPLLSPSN